MPVPADWKAWVSVTIAAVVLALFAAAFAYSFLLSFGPSPQAAIKPLDPERAAKITQLATLLAGVVTSVVAASLGVPVPGGGRLARVGAVAAKASPQASREAMALAYVAVYVLVGVAALVCWALGTSSPEQVRTLALTFLGFIAAVVKSQF